MAEVIDELVERVLSAAGPAERSLRRQLLDVLLALAQPAHLSYEEFLLRTTCLAGPTDLTVEIISPESVGRDRGDKFREYEQAGIPEYWLLDPQTGAPGSTSLDRTASIA